jgi:hypothetical protein
VVAAVLADEGTINVVEMEVAGELIGCRVAREPSVATGLVVREKADRQCSDYRVVAMIPRLPSSSPARPRGCPLAST